MTAEEVYARCLEQHKARISFLRPEQIKRTFPRLHRIGKTNQCMLEIVTEYWSKEKK